MSSIKVAHKTVKLCECGGDNSRADNGIYSRRDVTRQCRAGVEDDYLYEGGRDADNSIQVLTMHVRTSSLTNAIYLDQIQNMVW